MLPKLSERAAMRCTSHISRFYPAWKQAELRQSGGEALNQMLDFIDACTGHLSTLRNQIAEGETPCIDTNWPLPGQPEEAEPEKEIVYVDRQVIKEIENTDRLDELESRLKAAQEALERKAPEPEPIDASYDEPPVEIADLIDPSLTPKQNLDVLAAKFAAAKNLEEYCRSNNDMEGAMKHLKDAERFESGINWNRAVLVEVV